MNNRTYDPQAESLKVFWDSQQERLSLLSGKTITDEVLNLTAAFGDSEIAAFEKLMQTQKELAALLDQAPLAPVAAAPAPKGIPNPIIDNLDLSDPRTVRRFEIRSVGRDDVPRTESMVPTFGVLLMLGRKDAYTDAMADYFTGKGLTVKRIEQNLTEEEAQALITETAKEGPITGMACAANAYDESAVAKIFPEPS